MASQTYKKCFDKIISLTKAVNKAAKVYPDHNGKIGCNNHLYSIKKKLIKETVTDIVNSNTKSIEIILKFDSELEDKSIITFYFKKDNIYQTFHINKNEYHELKNIIGGEMYD